MKQNIFLILVIIGLGVIPFFFIPHAAFLGSDDMGKAAILATGYRPWFKPLWEPPSSEVQSLLFCLQTGLGCLVLGYIFGRLKRVS